MLKSEQAFELNIKPGTPEHHPFVFPDKGHQRPHHGPGDAVFRVVTKPHSQFRREGSDLHMEMAISLLEALVGFEREIDVFGHAVRLAHADRILNEGDVIVVKTSGLPVLDSSAKGDLIVHVHVHFPATLTDEQKHEIRRLGI